jgi:hypothetical protein
MKALLYLKQNNKLTKFGNEEYPDSIENIKEIIIIDDRFKALARSLGIDIVPNDMKMKFKVIAGSELGDEVMFVHEKI